MFLFVIITTVTVTDIVKERGLDLLDEIGCRHRRFYG